MVPAGLVQVVEPEAAGGWKPAGVDLKNGRLAGLGTPDGKVVMPEFRVQPRDEGSFLLVGADGNLGGSGSEHRANDAERLLAHDLLDTVNSLPDCIEAGWTRFENLPDPVP